MRPGVEILEDRSLPAIGFLSGFGVGVIGMRPTIHSNAVATDPAGDTYITGSFRGTVALDPKLPSNTITTNGTEDAFVVKYSPTGTMLWAKTFAGQITTLPGNVVTYATSQGSAIAVDSQGDVFVAGGYSGKVNVTGVSGVITINSATATTQVYVTKLNPSGNALWLDTVAGTTGDLDEAFALALDGAGGAVIAGSFSDSATFGTTTLTAGGASEGFASRINSIGSFVWAVATLGSSGSNSQINGLAVDGSGNVDLAGFFSGTVDFDPSSGTKNLTSAGSDDAVFWKLNSSGQFQWARSYGSTDYDAATAIAVDSSGDIFATGAFSDTVNFGTISIPDILTAVPTTIDTFVLKVDPNGNEVWVKGLIGPGGWSKGQGIAVDPTGQIDLAGAFTGQVDFDPNSGTDNLTSVGYTDVFVEGLSPAGSLVYVFQAGMTNFNAALGIAVNASGTASITGTYSGSIAFGSFPVGAIGIASIFVAQLSTQLPTPAAPSPPLLEASSDTGRSRTDGITSVTSPVFDVNTAGASNTVELLRNGVMVNQRTGPGMIMDQGPVPGGTYIYTAIQFTPAGIASIASSGTSVTIITTPPLAPSAPTLLAIDDSGLADNITNVLLPHFSVVALANTTIQIVQTSGPGLNIGSLFTATGGIILVMPSQPLIDGIYIIQAQAIDLAGNLGPLSQAFTFTIRTALPLSPSTPSLLASDVTGPTGSNLTSDVRPQIVGTATAGTTIQVINTSTKLILATASADLSGSYLAQIRSPLRDLQYSVDVVAIDFVGNISPPSPPLTFTIDTTPPAKTSILTLLTADDSGTKGDNTTNVRQPRLTGTAEALSTVQIVDGSGNLEGSAVAAADGTFTVTLSTSLIDGTYSLQGRATDLAGNLGPLGPALSLTILGTLPGAPGAPSILTADDSGGPDLTNVNPPRLTGTAPANDTVQIVVAKGTMVYASATASAKGTYIATLTNALKDGTYTLDAVATDVAGNVSPASPTLTFTIDTTPPAEPSVLTLFAADDSGTLGDEITNVRQPRLTGTAEAMSTVQVFDGLGILDGSTVATASGTFTVTLSTSLKDRPYNLQARATDPAGNVGLLGPALPLTILGTLPAAPGVPSIFSADDSGGPGLTNVPQPRLTGTAPAYDAVQIVGTKGTTVYASTTASASGIYVVQLTNALVDGTYLLDAVATDVAGNISPSGPTFSLTILPPTAPTAPILLAQDDSGTMGDNITNIRQPRLTATAMAGLTVLLENASNAVLGTTTATASGAITISPSSPLMDGKYVLDLVAVDVAGNVSALSGTITLVILATPPKLVAPSLLVADDTGVPGDGMTSVRRPRLVGTAAPGGRIDWISANGSVVVSATASSANGSYQLQPPSALINGVYPVKVRETDLAGNVSVNSAAFNLTIRVASGDFFGDSQSDISVYQTTAPNYFEIKRAATGGLSGTPYGIPGDVPINGDFWGDGHDDRVVFRPSTSTFFAYNPFTGALMVFQFGIPGDIPVCADYDGDGKTDFAVFRPSNDTWYVKLSATNTVFFQVFAYTGDIPVPADYLGNGHADFAVYRPSTSTYFVYDPISSSLGIVTIGIPGDIPVPGDYEGLGRVDYAVFQPSNQYWSILLNQTNTIMVWSWGIPGDIPVAGEYFANGRDNLTVYRPNSSLFFSLDLTTGGYQINQIGTPGIVLPLEAPITSWFKFSGSAKGQAIHVSRSVPEAPALVVIDEAFPDPIDSMPMSVGNVLTARKAASFGRAIDALSLESWRTRA